MLEPFADRKRRSPAILLAVAFACILVSCADAAPAETSRRRPVRHPVPLVPPHVATSFQTALNDWATAANHRGVSAAVILGNGAEWVSTAGIEGEDAPLLPEHLVVIASITKTMTGAVILQLAEEGILDLDDPVSHWLGARPNVEPTITIRQLLNHTNGLDNYTASAEILDAGCWVLGVRC